VASRTDPSRAWSCWERECPRREVLDEALRAADAAKASRKEPTRLRRHTRVWQFFGFACSPAPPLPLPTGDCGRRA